MKATFWKVLGSLFLLVALLVGIISFVPVPKAYALTDPLADCEQLFSGNYSSHSAQYTPTPFQINGADITGHAVLNPPPAIQNIERVFYFWSGTTTTRIDYWGANKPADGDPSIAPMGWPLPGAHEYALLVTPIGGGTVSRTTNRREPNTVSGGQWMEIGSHSGCIVTYSRVTSFTFMVNDPNLDDNAGGPYVQIYEWWPR